MATDNPKISVDFLKQNYPGLSEELEDEDLQSIVQQLEKAMIKTKGALQRVSREALQILVEKKDFPVFALEILKPKEEHLADPLPELLGKRKIEDVIDERIAAKQRVQREKRPTRTLSYVTKSAAFQNLNVQRRISYNNPFFFQTISLPRGFVTEAFRIPGPTEKLDENKDHHPRFIVELKKLVDSFTTAAATDESYATVLNQRVLWTKSGHWLKMDDGTEGVEPDFCMEEIASPHDSVTPRSDRVVLPHTKYNVTVALEQKKKIIPSDQFESIDYGERLIIIQDRESTYTGLFQFCDDRADIRWFRVFLKDDEFHSCITTPARLDISGGSGQLQLLTMLSLRAADLGLTRPTPPNGFDLHKKLEEGATSIAYEAQHNGLPAVLKIYKTGFEAYADPEAQILNHLTEHHVVGISGCEKVGPPVALKFPEIFDPMEVVTSAHVKQILECLKGAHGAGVVHRDIRPENIMVNSNGEARLIDWGAAYMANGGSGSTEFIGTFRYASDAVLEAAINSSPRKPQPEDDLGSLVRAVLAINTVTIRQELAQLKQEDFRKARTFWQEKRQANASYECFFQAAAERDYAKLEEIVFG